MYWNNCTYLPNVTYLAKVRNTDEEDHHWGGEHACGRKEGGREGRTYAGCN